MSSLDTEAGRIIEACGQFAEQDEPCEFEMQVGTDVCNRVPCGKKSIGIHVQSEQNRCMSHILED